MNNKPNLFQQNPFNSNGNNNFRRDNLMPPKVNNLNTKTMIMNNQNKYNLNQMNNNQNMNNMNNNNNPQNYQQLQQQSIEEKKKQEELENQIRDHFKCYICLSTVQNPKFCRFCKKISCEECINKWLKNHNYCGICKHDISSNDMLDIKILGEMSTFFMNNLDNHPNNNYNQINNNNNNNFSGSKNYNKNNSIKNNLDNNQSIEENNNNMCIKHNNKIDYYCVQCDKYYCSNCLVFFGEEVKKHSHHLIIQVSQMNESSTKEALREFKKLPETKNALDDLIGQCNFKLTENEIKKKQIENFFNLIKRSYENKIDETSKDLNKILNNLKNQKDSVENSISSIPNGFNNIVNSNDYVQGSVVSKELKKINKIDETLEDNIIEKSKINPKLFIENYETDYLKIKVPYGGQYNEGMELFNQPINIIPGFPSRLVLKYLQNKIYISFSIDINLPLNAEDYPIFYSYITIKNNKYGLEFLNLSNQVLPQSFVQQGNQYQDGRIRQQVNSTDLNVRQFLYLGEDEKIIRMKVYIIKIYYK